MEKFVSIDAYIRSLDPDKQANIVELRRIIGQVVPEALESIKYGMPTFELHGNLVHFAAFKNHYSFFPGSVAIEAFQNDLVNYEISKGTIRFQLDQPIPTELIQRIVAFRVQQNVEKAKLKKNLKTH